MKEGAAPPLDMYPFDVVETIRYSMLSTTTHYFNATFDGAVERAGKLVPTGNRVEIIERVTGKIVWKSPT
jgi:hypothetical protein